ncbi:MAG: hypothetical protein FWH25_00680 [Syntrophorhabdaceae bacterium]|nr:hypothetical protein [Syntrophorhabdaceae bacterium]
MIGARKIVLAAAIMMSGCMMVGPDYVKPELPMPTAWSRTGSVDDSIAPYQARDLCLWWERLGDPVLTGLI